MELKTTPLMRCKRLVPAGAPHGDKKKKEGVSDELEGLSGETVSVHTVGHDKYAVMYKRFVRGRGDVAPLRPSQRKRDHRTLCAVDLEDGDVVGVLTYLEMSAMDTDGGWVPVYSVVDLCVRGDAKRRGIGARLLSEMGRPAIVERSGREHEAAFYARCGFSRREDVTMMVERDPVVSTRTSECLVWDP